MVLINKLKRRSKVQRFFYYFILITYIISYSFFAKSILSLTGIETILRIIALVFFLGLILIYFIGGLVSIISRRKKTFIVLSILISLFIPIFIFASLYIDKGISKLNSANKNEIIYTTNLITLKNNSIKNNSKNTVGMINDTDDIEGNILAKKLIKKENLNKIKIKYFDDYIEMLDAMYSKKINGVLVSSNYSVMFQNEEKFANIGNETKKIYQYSEKRKKKETKQKKVKTLTEPFTLLLIGVDSVGETINANTSFNGDTLMMITFNPKTMNAIVFSIPRDTYVPISCQGNAKNKINSSAYGGTNCVIKTITNFTGIDIDYYVKINFKGVVDLVNAVNGVDVDVPIKFCEQDSNRDWGEHEICLNKGQQTLNGEQALAFARHRKTLARGDFDRVQNQQLVVEALAQKITTIRDIDDFYNILDSITKNIDTNMQTSEMLSFYEVIKNMMQRIKIENGDFFTIEKTDLIGSDKMINGAYTFQYNSESLKQITDAMKVNLEIKKADLIKEFNFSINNEYEPEVYGKRTYTKKNNQKKKVQNQK